MFELYRISQLFLRGENILNLNQGCIGGLHTVCHCKQKWSATQLTLLPASQEAATAANTATNQHLSETAAILKTRDSTATTARSCQQRAARPPF